MMKLNFFLNVLVVFVPLYTFLGFYTPPPHASLFISIIVSHIFQIFHISNFLDIVPFPIFQICILPIFSIPYHSLCLSSKYKINIPFFTRMNFSNFRNRRKLIKFWGIDLYAILKPSAKFKRKWFTSFKIFPLLIFGYLACILMGKHTEKNVT